LQLRPLTHDLMKNTLEVLGFRVTKVRITALVGNTYHARVHYARGRGIKAPGAAAGDGSSGAADQLPAEVDVDARPSGAPQSAAALLSCLLFCFYDTIPPAGQPAGRPVLHASQRHY
jgi:bifunctional DNase/RNase